MGYQKLKDAIARFGDLKIAVFGDMMLDRNIYIEPKSLSGEKKGRINFLETGQEDILGGAANAAANIMKLGAGKVALFGVVGNDEIGKKIKHLAACAGIQERISIEKGRPSTLKTRFFAEQDLQMRVDNEIETPIKKQTENQATASAKNMRIDNYDAILISDYAKRFVNSNIITYISKIRQNANVKIIVDPKANLEFYRGANIIKLNRLGLERYGRVNPFNSQEIENLVNKLELDALVLTLGEKGAIVYQDTQNKIAKFSFPGIKTPKEVSDATGAGDTFAAALTLGIAAKLDIYNATELANIAAGFKVTKFGTYAVSRKELEQELEIVKNAEKQNYKR